MTTPIDLAGVFLMLRDSQLQVARAVLAIRRGDKLAAESHLRAAQMALTTAERDARERALDAPRDR
jgi:hypothetical protein